MRTKGDPIVSRQSVIENLLTYNTIGSQQMLAYNESDLGRIFCRYILMKIVITHIFTMLLWVTSWLGFILFI